MKLQTSGTARAAAAGGISKTSRPKTAKKTDGKPTGKPGAKSAAAASPLRALKAPAAKSSAKAKSSAPPKAKRVKDSDAPLVESPRDKERRSLALSAAELAIESALDKKAVGPVLIDVSSQASYTDYIGVVSGRSDRQVEAIADHVSVTMKKAGFTLVGREGTNNGRWTLLDFGDMILHIFYHPVREVYDIEGLWVGAVRVPLKNVPPEALHFQGDALYAPS